MLVGGWRQISGRILENKNKVLTVHQLRRTAAFLRRLIPTFLTVCFARLVVARRTAVFVWATYAVEVGNLDRRLAAGRATLAWEGFPMKINSGHPPHPR
jgi:hypothetical protein